MTRNRRRAASVRRTIATATLAATGSVPVACGAETDYPNTPRPPSPINVTAAITDDRVRISPRSFGAGPIVLIIANQSRRSQEFTLETDGGPNGPPGTRQTSSAVNPRGTAELKVDVEPGAYKLSVKTQGVEPAAFRVARSRPSAQNELLQP